MISQLTLPTKKIFKGFDEKTHLFRHVEVYLQNLDVGVDGLINDFCYQV